MPRRVMERLCAAGLLHAVTYSREEITRVRGGLRKKGMTNKRGFGVAAVSSLFKWPQRLRFTTL